MKKTEILTGISSLMSQQKKNNLHLFKGTKCELKRIKFPTKNIFLIFVFTFKITKILKSDTIVKIQTNGEKD